MSLVVREDLSIAIPEAMAEELGLHAGSPVEWERAAGGGYTLRPAPTREEAVDRFCSSLKGYLKSGESAVAGLVREREEDARREEAA